MKDQNDKRTRELIDPPKRGPGRPKTGEAMTPAERQRAYRERNAGHQAWVRPTRQLERAKQLIEAELAEMTSGRSDFGRPYHRNRASGMADMALVLGVLTQDEYAALNDKIRDA
ncbi:hypothetical protein [Hydrocarboniphaga sp.]|uniref:hypothetical protein n=1 Tax=Hydrocarboniphaga sp. TaxID=2033016 RepID=UPI002ABB5334|nr:hypothetical protein [Hydrocarboniphaga sp.]MDZ4080946.1 hypothetical protein [Hydrocarboniphaga sp.]